MGTKSCQGNSAAQFLRAYCASGSFSLPPMCGKWHADLTARFTPLLYGEYMVRQQASCRGVRCGFCAGLFNRFPLSWLRRSRRESRSPLLAAGSTEVTAPARGTVDSLEAGARELPLVRYPSGDASEVADSEVNQCVAFERVFESKSRIHSWI
jgi:hypothetical protein